MQKTKSNIALKAAFIAVLVIVLLVPTLMINNLVTERQSRQSEAFTEISSKWANRQTLVGPVLSIPYVTKSKDSCGNVIGIVRHYKHILPEKLVISGNVTPEKRYRGLFEIVVYKAQLGLSGSFANSELTIPNVPAENILYGEAILSVGITDLRGIEDNVFLKWNSDSYSFNPGIETKDISNSGISCKVAINPKDSATGLSQFNLYLNLKGSEHLYFTPVGKETNINIESNWANPSFDGAFLPDERNITQAGFNAKWKVLHLNRNFPQSWINKSYDLDNSAFGINLILALDNYTKTDRSIKYAVLFIGLTFLTFFFLELINKLSIHPLQYLLVGFALCLFYVLLLSISEHINYNLSYLIASLMTIGLIWWYSRSILGEKKLATLVAGNLVILYGFIYTIIQLQDYALLMGSFGLFLILAVIMQFSKKVDWKAFEIASSQKQDKSPYRVNRERVVRSEYVQAQTENPYSSPIVQKADDTENLKDSTQDETTQS